MLMRILLGPFETKKQTKSCCLTKWRSILVLFPPKNPLRLRKVCMSVCNTTKVITKAFSPEVPTPKEAPTTAILELCCIEGCPRTHSNHVYHGSAGHMRGIPNSQRFVACYHCNSIRNELIILLLYIKDVPRALYPRTWSLLC